MAPHERILDRPAHRDNLQIILRINIFPPGVVRMPPEGKVMPHLVEEERLPGAHGGVLEAEGAEDVFIVASVGVQDVQFAFVPEGGMATFPDLE